MKLVVGLGNPGKNYENTRHNIGYLVLNNYLGDVIWKRKHKSLIYLKDDVLYVKPTTFMNLSGDAVKRIVDYYKIEIKDVLIICDDLDQNVGDYKIKMVSGSGGHNGLNSIISSLKTTSFARLKIGISNNKMMETKDYVLGLFSKKEMIILTDLFPRFNEILECFSSMGIDKVLNSYRSGDIE